MLMNTLSWLKDKCVFSQKNVEYVFVDEFTDQEIIDQAWTLVKPSGINILSQQDLYAVAMIGDRVVGALFTSSVGPTFSFDIIVHPNYQKQGIGFELAKIGNSLQYEDGFEIQFPEGIKHNIATPEGGKLVEKLKSNKKMSSRDIGINPVPSLAEIEAAWNAKGIQNAMFEKNGTIFLNKIIVPKEQRGIGIGTSAMQELIDYADKTGQRIALTPSREFGGNKSRLESFYQGFGFKRYKGFDVRETMMRDPQNKQLLDKKQFVLKICKFAAPISSFSAELSRLRPQIAAAAQNIYDAWSQDENDDFGGGICDEIAREISGIIAANIADVELDEYGHEGDDHAAVIATRGNEQYLIDIPPSVYETGGGYNWTKRVGVTFSPDDIYIGAL